MNADAFFALTGYRFRNPDLLQQALTHRSLSRGRSYERLEFLGDSILNLVISRHIFHRFDDADEGRLSRIRAALVNAESLATVAREIGLGEHIRFGGGELKSGARRRASILSDVLEALFGAVFLDSDYAATERVILDLFRARLRHVDRRDCLKDPKTRLQEHLQGRNLALPEYAVEATAGKQHARVFTVCCRVPELGLESAGTGSSRKKAEQRAAQQLLEMIES